MRRTNSAKDPELLANNPICAGLAVLPVFHDLPRLIRDFFWKMVG
jgi:hypothetical protein